MSDADAPGSGVEFTSELGIEVIGPRDGAFVLELELGPTHMSRANRAHGGLLFTLLDTALGRSVLMSLPEGRGCATVEIKINYFRPVQSGRIRAWGRLRELTRSLGYADGEIETEEGKVLARASGTFFLTDTLRQDTRVPPRRRGRMQANFRDGSRAGHFIRTGAPSRTLAACRCGLT